MPGIGTYFSDCFGIHPDVIAAYGAINISLINDLPLFIDPFLLFNSEQEEYQEIHSKMIEYLRFLRDQSSNFTELPSGMLKAWYLFSEVKQTWLGFSNEGNSGRGLGSEFAYGLHDGLNSIFKSFGEETITQMPHMEKLCLISPNVGRDKISDFTTNFAKEYLLEYSQTFAKRHLHESQCRIVSVPKVSFSYQTRTWMPKTFYLPWYNDDYVILTPRDMLTREDTFINRTDMIRNLEQIAPSVSDETLRFELNNYLHGALGDQKRQPTKEEKSTPQKR